MVVPKYKTVMEENKQNVLVREDEYQLEEDCVLDRPVKICEFVCDFLHMDELAEEYIYVIGMDTRLKPVGISEVGHGSVDACLSSMRSIMMRLLLMGASKYVLVHNHPSGDATPSREDILMTKTAVRAGELMDIPLVDHIVIGDKVYAAIGDIVNGRGKKTAELREFGYTGI